MHHPTLPAETRAELHRPDRIAYSLTDPALPPRKPLTFSMPAIETSPEQKILSGFEPVAVSVAPEGMERELYTNPVGLASVSSVVWRERVVSGPSDPPKDQHGLGTGANPTAGVVIVIIDPVKLSQPEADAKADPRSARNVAPWRTNSAEAEIVGLQADREMCIEFTPPDVTATYAQHGHASCMLFGDCGARAGNDPWCGGDGVLGVGSELPP